MQLAYSAHFHSNVNLTCFYPNIFDIEKWIAVCPSSVSATMKRRLEAGSASLQEAKRAQEDSSSDEESQLSRQGRCIDVMNSFRQKQKICCCVLWQHLFLRVVCWFFRLEPEWFPQRPGWSSAGIFLQNFSRWSGQWRQTNPLQFHHVQQCVTETHGKKITFMLRCLSFSF